MKKIIALIAFLIIGLSAVAQPTDYGIKTEFNDKSLKNEYLFMVTWKVTGLDTSTANATATSSGFDATPFIASYLQGDLTNYTTRDTTVDNYIHSNYIYAQVTINGTGSADSLAYVYLQGLGVNGTYYTFDTLNTAKTTPCQTIINLAGQRLYTQWRIVVNVKDLTESMYAGEFNIKIFARKPYKI